MREPTVRWKQCVDQTMLENISEEDDLENKKYWHLICRKGKEKVMEEEELYSY